MMKKTILITGTLVVVLAFLWLFVWKFLPIGINDAEWGHISRTGLPSGGGAGLSWTAWQTSELDKITLFSVQTNVPLDHPISAYRFGKGENQFLTFGFYEAKCILDDGREVIVPALGRESWTRMKWHWPLAVLALGVGIAGTGIVWAGLSQELSRG